MRVTSLGHAGLFVETAGGSVLCDPWFTPAFFASWFPFPSNADVDITQLRRPDYLYVSHLHHDHFDPRFLQRHVDKDVTVLLPDYPTDDLREGLQALGFSRFLPTRNGKAVELDGLRVMISAVASPADGPIGDSILALDDGNARLLNQNDARPLDHDAIVAFGPYDAHFLQYSGAIWFPMVYAFPDRMKRTLGRRKRVNGMDRAMRYVRQYGARFVFPFAGPPCFLDDDLFSFNDVDRDPSNVFPDQTVFLEHMASAGLDNGRLLVPGSVAVLDDDGCAVTHLQSDQQVQAIFGDKGPYLRRYQQSQRPRIDAEKATWPTATTDLAAQLKAWWEPLLAQADHLCAGVGARVLLTTGGDRIVVDFLDRRVDRWSGETCRYRFEIPRPLVEACVQRREADWVNELFLSCRFAAERDGAYNEYVYTFFKALSEERLQYVEGWYAEQGAEDEECRAGEYLIQRRCPHLKADLVRFGRVDGDTLRCTMHGWRFDVATGRCLTSEGHRLRTRLDEQPELPRPRVPADEPRDDPRP